MVPSTFGGSHPLPPTLPINRLNSHRSKPPPSTPPPLYIFQSPTLDLLLHHPSQTLLHPSSLLSSLPSPSQSSFLSLLPPLQTPIHSVILASIPAALPPHHSFKSLRSIFHTLSPQLASLTAHATSLAEFHTRHRYCGLCGAPTVSDLLGARRKCSKNLKGEEPHHVTPQSLQSISSCPGVWFPRVDPVVIMLLINPRTEKALLARQSNFPNFMYSPIAGFMEHAEGVDDAVRRETMEELGLQVGEVRFFGSQPWPFPYSLMLACVARTDSLHIVIDKTELEDAKWFSREEVAEMIRAQTGRQQQSEAHVTNNHLWVPFKSAIAGELCTAFANRHPTTVFEQQPNSGNKSRM